LVDRHESVSVFSSLQDAVVEALAEISSWPEKETSSRAVQLQSALRQSEFCIARLVFKKVFDYNVVLCKISQRRSIDLYEAVNTAEDIISEMKSLRQNAECEFHEFLFSAQETAQNQGFCLDMPRLTPRQINRCNVAAATNEEYFRVGIFIPLLDSFIANLESRFTADKSIIGGLRYLIPADPTVGPTTKQIQSIKVLGEFYKEDLTKLLEELVPELRLWYKKQQPFAFFPFLQRFSPD